MYILKEYSFLYHRYVYSFGLRNGVICAIFMLLKVFRGGTVKSILNFALDLGEKMLTAEKNLSKPANK